MCKQAGSTTSCFPDGHSLLVLKLVGQLFSVSDARHPVVTPYMLFMAQCLTQVPLHQQMLLLAAGPLTAIPLLLFAGGARRIPLSLLGMLQYIGPTLQLALGVWVFGEPFAGGRAQGFMIIWAACLLFSAELLWRHRENLR